MKSSSYKLTTLGELIKNSLTLLNGLIIKIIKY